MKSVFDVGLMAMVAAACNAGIAPEDPLGSFPIGFIDAPANNAEFAEGEVVSFRGHADDVEDIAVTGAGLQWTSDIDGLLGEGGSIDVTGLSLGQHIITLTITDSRIPA